MSNASELESLIYQGADYCMQRNAKGFASLFTENAELIIGGQSIVGNVLIEQVTQDYFARRLEIQIQIQQISIQDSQAIVKWIWSDNQKSGTINTIIMQFHQGLIQRWQED